MNDVMALQWETVLSAVSCISPEREGRNGGNIEDKEGYDDMMGVVGRGVMAVRPLATASMRSTRTRSWSAAAAKRTRGGSSDKLPFPRHLSPIHTPFGIRGNSTGSATKPTSTNPAIGNVSWAPIATATATVTLVGFATAWIYYCHPIRSDRDTRSRSHQHASILAHSVQHGNPTIPPPGDSGSHRIHHRSIVDTSSFPFYECLLEQLRVVVYHEARDAEHITSDSGRNKPSGLVGLACRHCSGTEGNGTTPQALRFTEEASIFPQDRRSLAREVSNKMYHHVVQCEQCPLATRAKLQKLHREHHRSKPPMDTVTREERLFFRDLWYRMGHKDMMEMRRR